MECDRVRNLAEKKAIIVVDLVHDFVDGKFGSDCAKEVARKIREFLLRSKDIVIVMTRDCHIKDDPEFSVWGEHCLQGTEGSELVPELSDINSHVVTKRHYDAFYDSDLDGFLRARRITSLLVCGISTDICVRHTVAGAFFRNYRIAILEDLCASIDPDAHEKALKEMKNIYGASVIMSGEVKM